MMTRKQFLRSALEASAAALGVTILSACGGTAPQPFPDSAMAKNPMGSGGGSDAMTPDAQTHGCLQDGTAVTIYSNHGHVLVVTISDMTAGRQKSYDIQGTSDHPHTVVLTAAQFQQLAQNQAIMTTSSFDADHSHDILVACA